MSRQEGGKLISKEEAKVNRLTYEITYHTLFFWFELGFIEQFSDVRKFQSTLFLRVSDNSKTWIFSNNSFYTPRTPSQKKH